MHFIPEPEMINLPKQELEMFFQVCLTDNPFYQAPVFHGWVLRVAKESPRIRSKKIVWDTEER